MALCMKIMAKSRSLVAWAWPALLIPAAAFILWQEASPTPPRAQMLPQDRAVAVLASNLPGTGSAIGPLRLAGALALRSDDAGFGGLSGLAALPDGRLLAVSDAGQWLVLRPVISDGRLSNVADVRMGAYVSGTDKSLMDGEAVVVTPGGRTLISLEQQHRIAVFSGSGPPFKPEGVIFRTAAAGWPANGGGEALALLPDGAMLWVSEQAKRDDGAHIALLTAADGTTRSIGIPGLPDFSPTDAVMFDATRLILLHRLYSGIENEAAISIVDLAPVLAGGDTATLRLLARWGRRGPWPVDNMEGVALLKENSRPVLYLVSDDNFNPTQTTILLRFDITLPLAAAPSP
jgi:hypothetical protein